MSIYLGDGENDPAFLCSNRGWGDFCAWVHHLDADAYGELVHLCEYAWCQNLDTLRQQIHDAVAHEDPRGDAKEIAAALLELLPDDGAIVITDGLSPVSTRESRQRENDGSRLLEGWITLSSKDEEGEKHGSTHVYIGSGGNIEKGPAHMVGKKVGELSSTHKVTAVHGETHPDEKKSGKNPLSSSQTPLTSPKGETTISSSGDKTQPKEEPKMTTAVTKKPWEMTRDEYRAARQAVPQTPDGYPDYAKLKELGLNDDYKDVVVNAIKRGDVVPQHVIDSDARAIQAQAQKKLQAEFGADYFERLEDMAKKASSVHEVLRREGNQLQVRAKQSGANFILHNKGDIVWDGDTPLIVTKASKLQKVRADGQIWSYAQDITTREAKPAERALADKAKLAQDALRRYDTFQNNTSYPDLKKEQMGEYERAVRAALGDVK